MKLLIALIFALVTIFGSLLGLRHCEGNEPLPQAGAHPTLGRAPR